MFNISNTTWIYYTERSKAKLIALTNDPRSALLQAADLLRRPDLHLAQTTWENKQVLHYTSYEDTTLIKAQSSAIYFPIESFYILGEPIPPKPIFNERHGFGLVLNQGTEIKEGARVIKGKALRREPILREWVLSNQDPNIEIYGKWPEHVMNLDTRMKGFISLPVLIEKLKTWKYSLCIPIQRGWTTTKYIELIQCGVVPFLHPFYDEKELVLFPEIIRVKTPDELKERIKFLDSNPEAYNKLWDELHKLVFRPEHISGSAFSDIIDYVVQN